MDKPKLLEALAALPESGVKRTKTGRLRELLPEIEAAQAAGYGNEAIAKALTEQGLEVSKRTLETMLSRIRKEMKERAEGARPTPATRSPVSSAGQPATAQGAAKAANLDERKMPQEATGETSPEEANSGKRKILSRKDLRKAKQSGDDEIDQFINE